MVTSTRPLKQSLVVLAPLFVQAFEGLGKAERPVNFCIKLRRRLLKHVSRVGGDQHQRNGSSTAHSSKKHKRSAIIQNLNSNELEQLQ